MPELSNYNFCNGYEMKATNEQIGSLQFGHYITYVAYKDRWYCCNDSSVSEDRSIPNSTFYNSYLIIYEAQNSIKDMRL
jgi:ubiquitin C-terminal hydrolase